MQEGCCEFLSIPTVSAHALFREKVFPLCGFAARCEWGAQSILRCL